MKITVAKGDGIGPEIMDSVLRIFEHVKVPLEYDFIDIGEKVYLQGEKSGISSESWDKIKENKILFKGPITTPRGKGWKSINVTLRKTLGLYANVRPISNWYPILNKEYDLNMTVVRENEEDLYAGIEHRQTNEVTQCLKLITRSGSERIARYAFEYAKKTGKTKVVCMVKDNIMKITDGLFLEVCEEISKEYPEIEFTSQIIDIGAAKVATVPQTFEVIVTPNLYGDIISDIAAEVSGSVGISPSYNIGDEYSMFEAIHGSAPDIAGLNIANPSGILLAGIYLLNYLGLVEYSNKITNAWLKTIEDGHSTKDLGGMLGTKEFTDKIIENIGLSSELRKSNFKPKDIKIPKINGFSKIKHKKELVGVDIFIDAETTPDDLATILLPLSGSTPLQMITNRGVVVWKKFNEATNCTDHWRCRFQASDGRVITNKEIIGLLNRLVSSGVDVIKTENLYNFDGNPGYSLGQGQ